MYEHAWIFINKFFKYCILGILYNALMYKNEFGQAHRIELVSKIPTKFILCFSEVYSTFYEFW
jgi:hypothetical protein